MAFTFDFHDLRPAKGLITDRVLLRRPVTFLNCFTLSHELSRGDLSEDIAI